MSLPPLGNPLIRFRGWLQDNRAQAEIAGIAAVALGLIVVMLVITIIVIYRMLR
jgi:hypothetical protein